MAKVLRLHSSGIETLQGWADSQRYSTNVINQIVDPNGGAVQKPITSIPSPFAQIDLVKTAFKIVSEQDQNGDYNNIAQNTIYNKMVSDSLDVGQLFFEYSKHRNNIDIIVWDRNRDLQALLDSDNPALRQLGETYSLYLTQDAASNNFHLMQGLYLLNYRYGPRTINIIGATSPTTLFFSTPNDLSYTQIFFGNDKAFDDQYLPLYRRDMEYHKYLWLLKVSNANFATLFPEVNSYLDACLAMSDQGRRQQLQQLQQLHANDFTPYRNVVVGGNIGQPVEILGINFHEKLPNTAVIQNSDFVIRSTRSQERPLVLPVSTFTLPWVYTCDNWDQNTRTPYVDNTPIDQRILPQVGDQYPYLTISDFLEDTIVKMPHEFNDNLYYGGKADGDDANCYLLPLKPLFFKYFSIDDLQQNNMLSLRTNAGGVVADLKIPTQQGFITYTRIYFNNNETHIDATHNDGSIFDCDFMFASLSNIRYADPRMAAYRFALLSNFASRVQYNVNAFKEFQQLTPSGMVIRNTNNANYKKCQTYLFERENVEFIQIEADGNKGVIVPKFVQQQGTNQYTFAVDFGTTNTHVAYSVNGAPAQSFDICEQDIQMQYYANYGTDAYPFDADFIPKTVGENTDFHFPMRTTLAVGQNTNWNQAVWPLSHVNIPFTYEKRQMYAYNNILTNLKWSNDEENVLKIQAYIESLLLILRNKVILNNGDLSRTKLVWFYPVSMTQGRYNNFRTAWRQSYQRYFGANNNIESMTESVAPYEFFKARFGAASTVLVDIGGGTSDVVIARNNEIQCITSFRFAANSIFGSGYAHAHAAQLNGIVRQFKDEILDVLSQSESIDVNQLQQVFNDLNATNNSADIASFFFSLHDNAKIIENGVQDRLNFNQKLSLDDQQKIVFLLFYTAIVYHVAHIMKAKNLGMPRKLAFSGNGSKVVAVVTPDHDLLSRYSQLIFEKVFEEAYPADGLDIVTDANPKEATCRGGIINPQNQEYRTIAERKVVLKSDDNCSFVTTETYQDIDNDRYVLSVVDRVEAFMNFFFDLDRVNNISFTNSFGICQNSIDVARRICRRDLQNFTNDGLRQKLQEVAREDVIEESLFFYPLVGVLNALSTAIYENNNNN